MQTCTCASDTSQLFTPAAPWILPLMANRLIAAAGSSAITSASELQVLKSWMCRIQSVAFLLAAGPIDNCAVLPLYLCLP
ncbi:MAG: hypothetical protein JXA25_15725 [Anaerolineales bacterium]|nr:hypothetical protein [Anaerolineales bacterium]